MWRFIFSIVAFSCCLLASGQAASVPGMKPDWKPHELKIGFNAIRTGRTAFNTSFRSHELQAVLAMHQLNAVIDLGTEENTRGTSYLYENKGAYFRFGGDWNFVKDKKSGNALSLGLRYARAFFEDQLEYSADQGFGDQDFNFSNPNLNARWMELTFNLRGKVVSNLYTGFTMRWQFSRKVNGEGVLQTYDIPGFGKTKRQNSTAFDYYLMWRVPFNKK